MCRTKTKSKSSKEIWGLQILLKSSLPLENSSNWCVNSKQSFWRTSKAFLLNGRDQQPPKSRLTTIVLAFFTSKRENQTCRLCRNQKGAENHREQPKLNGKQKTVHIASSNQGHRNVAFAMLPFRSFLSHAAGSVSVHTALTDACATSRKHIN